MSFNKQRPQLPDAILNGVSSDAEGFQNQILRPIIKMQSDLLMAHLQAKLEVMKINLSLLNEEQQVKQISQLFHKDQAFKREIIGMVIGQFSLEEYNNYLTMYKELNKRVIQIVLERVLTTASFISTKSL